METRASTRTRLSVFPVLVALILNVVVSSPIAPLLASPTLALAGTSFDAADGNLAVDGAETDWCTAPNFIRKNDLPTGQTDNSYKAAKENELNPDVENGSIPNNKVDLDRLYIASETAASGDLFVYLGWVRNDTTGTGTISFELNQSDVVLSNGINNQRTVDDLLFEFNFQANPGSQGGYEVDLTYRVWDGSEWGDAIDMGGFAEGSVNAAAVTDCKNNNQQLGTGAFGEFAVNLTDLIGGDCRAFASIFAKSRSSNQITSELKEVIAPTPIDLSTCGQITILKQDEDGAALGGATFSVTPNPFTLTGSLSVTDNASPDDDSAAGTIHLSDVEPGQYQVCETAAPAGYIIDTTCETLTVGVNGSAEFGPFVNGLGDISWTKIDEQTGLPLCCATFTLAGTAGAATGFSLTVTDNGQNDEDADAGELLVTGLMLGTYRITETTPPAGYDLPNPAFQDVVLSGETASAGSAFEDAPQADASIDKEAVVDPIVAGEDASFTVTVNAGGTGASEDVVLTDENETGHDWTVTGADAGDCADTSIAVGETLTCNFGDVPNGESRTVTITMASDEDDCALGIANTASVASSNDHDASNNEDSDSITVLCPNPGVVKEAVVTPIVAGEDAVFTITVHAGGTGPAENVVLSDLNDTGHLWTVTGTDAGACADTSVADGETLSCTWASIEAGGDRTITITMTSGVGDCELGIDNTASITADADVDTSNNEDGDSIEVLCPNPGVSKEAVLDQITAGDDASFVIVVTAEGDDAAHGVVLTDLNDTAHVWTVSGADAADCGLDLLIEQGDTLTCEFGTIPAGESRTITITMTSDADDCALGIANTASITADADIDTSNNEDSDSITVLCPDIRIDKEPVESVVSAGEEAQFTILVLNDGPGTAYDVEVSDTLPLNTLWELIDDDGMDCSTEAVPGQQTITCTIDELAPGLENARTIVIGHDTVAAECGLLENDVTISASNEPAANTGNNSDSASIVVECPGLNFLKEADDDEIVAGEEASFTLHLWNAGPGDAFDVQLHDDLPVGLTWDFELLNADADDHCSIASSIIEGGAEQMSIDCEFGTLEPVDSPDDGKILLVFADTDETSCGLLENTATADASNLDEPLTRSASINVRCPQLVIDKVADAEVITITGPAGDLVATPSVVTWTLTYTLTDGPVTNAVIADEVPVGFVFLDASDGGQLVNGMVTWTFPTLSSSGSVTFRTTVDPETIDRVAPTVNVATIVSDETPEDEGEDQVRVEVVPPPLGGNPTPQPSVPNTAVAVGPNGEPVTVPLELLVAFFLGSLGALALANVRARGGSRR